MKLRKLVPFFCFISMLALVPGYSWAQLKAMARLENHHPFTQVQKSQHLGRTASTAQLTLTVGLKLRNQSEIDQLIARIHNPGDPLYGQYLTSQQFDDRFGPTAADYASVVQYLQSQGLKVNNKLNDRLSVQVQGSVSTIEQAFQVEMHNYKTSEGKLVYAPSMNPAVTADIQQKISSITGLNNFRTYRPHLRVANMSSIQRPNFTGSGAGNSLVAADIRKAYNVNPTFTGAGQTMALIELDGYTKSDISFYESANGISPGPVLSNVLIDGATGTPTSPNQTSGSPAGGPTEVTLDLEMMVALAPGASKIIVYESPGTTDTQWLDIFARIISDNSAKIVSCSWGAAESQDDSTIIQGESTYLSKMASMGISFFAAAGDSGAYDDGSYLTTKTLSIDDPGAQLYAVSSGGTRLSLNANGSYASESSWGTTSSASGGGGGISNNWTLPSWQNFTSSSSNKASVTMRNVPDFSLNADPATGYEVAVSGYSPGTTQAQLYYIIVGGTSAVAPLLAAFTASVNQARLAVGLPVMGFPNPSMYLVAQSSLYGQCFNDVKDGSTNLYYAAVPGYDLSTGWGSINATNLLQALASPILPPAPPSNLQFAMAPGSP